MWSIIFSTLWTGEHISIVDNSALLGVTLRWRLMFPTSESDRSPEIFIIQTYKKERTPEEDNQKENENENQSSACDEARDGGATID